MYYKTSSKVLYHAAPTTANNSALAYGTESRPVASLSETYLKRIRSLEDSIRQETGKDIALIAYRV